MTEIPKEIIRKKRKGIEETGTWVSDKREGGDERRREEIIK